MGILDDLKQQADRIRAEGDSRRTLEQQREAFYQESIRPVLRDAVTYVYELVAQLDVVRPEVRGEFHLPGHREPLQGVQSLPKISLDDRDQPRRVQLAFTYVTEPAEFSVSPPKAAEETRQFLLEGKHVFSDWPMRAEDGAVTGLRFSIPRMEIPAFLVIEADLEAQRIALSRINLHGFEDLTDYFRPDQIGPDWLDQLSRLLLNQREEVVEELGTEHRAELQRRLREGRAERDREMAERELELKRAEEEKRLSTRLQRMFNPGGRD